MYYLEDNWYEDILDNYISIIKEKLFIDIESDDLYFSGFNSQGDGAVFDFVMSKDEVIKFMKHNNLKETYEKLYKLLDSEIDFCINTEKNSFANYYSHSNTRYLDYELIDDNFDDLIDEIIKSQIDSLLEIIDKIRLELCDSIYAALNDYHDELFKELYNESNKRIDIE